MAVKVTSGSSKDPLVRVGGIAALATSLRKIGDTELSKEMKAVTKAAAEAIVPHAKRRVPVDSGALARSIKAQGTRRYARIKAGTDKTVPYARHVHAGHHPRARKRPVPFIRLAIPDAYEEIIKQFTDGMTRIAKKFEAKHGASRVVGRYRK